MKKVNNLLLVTVLLVAACTSTENKKKLGTQSSVQSGFESQIKPIKGLEIEAQVFKVDADKASQIELKNGGKISFPANAFVNQNGDLVSGEVDIAWKEFHSLTDIILSGIPMKYDSLGQEYNFVSGGMFTIAASQNAQELELATGKKAQVDLVSIDDTPCHNFYKIDEKSGDWSYVTTKNATPLLGDKKSEKQVEKIDYLLDTKPTNLKDFPSLNSDEIVAWKCLDKLSVQERKQLKKYARKSKLVSGSSPNTYNLEITFGTETKIVSVEPYLLETALKESKKVEQKQAKNFQEILDYQNNLASGKAIRSIEISNFGTYNWDYVHQIENPVYVKANFNVPGDVNLKLVRFFMVCPESNLQISCTAYENMTMPIDPKKKHCVIGILPNNRLVFADNSNFTEAVNSKSNGVSEFEFKDSGIELKSGQDLASQLNKIVGS